MSKRVRAAPVAGNSALLPLLRAIAAAAGDGTPLHRAVRTRSAAAVRTLLEHGADPRRPNANGSTPSLLATQTTGRSGSGSPEAKAEQARIIALLATSSRK